MFVDKNGCGRLDVGVADKHVEVCNETLPTCVYLIATPNYIIRCRYQV